MGQFTKPLFLGLCVFLVCFALTMAYPKGKGKAKDNAPSRKSVKAFDNRNKGKQEQLNKEKNEAPSPHRAKPSPEGIPPQAVEVSVSEHPRKEAKLKEGNKQNEALESFPLKGSQKVPAGEKAKNKKKKYPHYDPLQGQVPVEGPPRYPPTEQKISPPLPESIRVGKPESTTPSNEPNSNVNKEAPSNAQQQQQPQQQQPQQPGTPQQKSKVHKKATVHHKKHH